jgi:hypothetical protein
MIREVVGEPPIAACPIYFLTARRASADNVMYIGKTSSRGGRFKSGHRAIGELHNPEFDGQEKRIYMASVCLLSGDDYLPLEWMQPLEEAEVILDHVEWQLIHHFQPPLNKQKRSERRGNRLG